MRRVFLYLTMSLDGYVAGPDHELDWMIQTPDKELNDDIVALLNRADAGFLGFPTGSGMLPYWAGVANDPTASEGARAIAGAVGDIHAFVISNRTAELPFDNNAEVLVVTSDEELVAAVTRIKQRPGRDLGVPGGVRTAQTFARLGLIDEYVFLVHPVAIGRGKTVFTGKVDLTLTAAKRYQSGVVRLSYRPT